MTDPSPLTVMSALRTASDAGIDRLDAHLLLAAVVGRSRTWLLAHDDQTLDTPQGEAWRAALARRAAGEPMAYLLGEKEFFGLTLQVDASVLVPRPDTETLVNWAVDLLRQIGVSIPHPRVLDLGTGSGAIALAVKQGHPAAALTATDLSPSALSTARANGERQSLPIDWRLGDWWAAVPQERFHLVLSNPPYIAEGDPHLAALRHEPVLALTSGPDGLSALRHIVGHAAGHLEPGAWLLLEHGYDQAAAVQNLLGAAGFQDVATRRDLAGHPRCSGGRWANSQHPKIGHKA